MILKTNSLPPSILRVIKDKGTESPFSGEYDEKDEPGTYLCRHCGLALFRGHSKFPSGCGWPSFDEEIKDTVERLPDKDGQRTEILCKRCHAHLGHVFEGEGFTAQNIRHCVNSLSLDFVYNQDILDTEEAIFAAGCFWGVEYYFKQLPGVLKTEVGYSGGFTNAPSYEEVCSGNSGHFEAVRVLYDPKILTFKEIAQYFFEIHDPTQPDGQGPDRGEQYLSVIFYYNEEQENTATSLIEALQDKGYIIATRVLPVSPFWKAETYHQEYYTKTGKQPYCHHYVKRF